MLIILQFLHELLACKGVNMCLCGLWIEFSVWVVLVSMEFAENWREKSRTCCATCTVAIDDCRACRGRSLFFPEWRPSSPISGLSACQASRQMRQRGLAIRSAIVVLVWCSPILSTLCFLLTLDPI